jgi:hydroxypyruvate isomerase
MKLAGYELAANISLMFTEVSLLERFARARAAGFDAVEVWWPFAGPDPAASEVEEFLAACTAAGVRLVGMNLYAGDMAGGDRGIVSNPAQGAAFRASVAVAGTVAERTGCAVFNALYGQRLEQFSEQEQDDAATANLVHAMTELGRTGGTVLLEALTIGENGAYRLTNCAEVAAVITRVTAASGQDNVRLLFDTFHLTNNGEDLLIAVDQYGDLIGHVQLADSPGRGEPGTGTIDFVSTLSALTENGYRGPVAAEYRPVAGTEEGLGWIEQVAAQT